MSVWVRLKGGAAIEGDGQVCIAGPHGPIRRTVMDGAFEWPEEAGPIHGHFEITDPSPEAREQRRREEAAATEAEVQRLLRRLERLRGDGDVRAPDPETSASVPPPPPPPVAASAPVPASAPPAIQAAARRAEMERQSLPIRRR